MTRKDYEKVAKILRMHRAGDDDGASSATIASIAGYLASMFEEDNARFSAPRFFEACGLNEDGGEWII